MTRHNLSPADLLDSTKYELIKKVHYTELKSFILKETGYKTPLIVFYGIFQIAAIALFSGLSGFYAYRFIFHGEFSPQVIAILISLAISFSVLIVVHELLHAMAFILLGKKNIGFGAQWKKFLFYAEADMQVLDMFEMIIVALTPFITILITGILMFIASSDLTLSITGLMIVLIHFLFCGGDFAIISFFIRNKNEKLYTFDNRKERTTYYYRTITHEQ